MAESIPGKYLKKISAKLDWKIIVFLAVVALGIFFRVYHFHDWLFFKMDQARDASTIKQAFMNGSGWLPLLGPKAGGTSANLGPVFYYFQYLSAVIFQSVSPSVLAYPDLLFSILSIPLLYLFLKKYFNRDWSLILAGLYSLCFLGIEYSRFAWNPNSLVFFNLLFFYALLNVFDESVKYKLRWVILAGLSFAISTQLHFLSFATLPVITVIFFFFIRREIKKNLDWKKIIIFLGIIFLVYLPVFANEIITHGKDSSAFLAAVKSKPSHHSLWENINRNVRYWGQYWLLIATSCVSKGENIVSSAIAWALLMIPGLFLAIKFYRGEKNGLRKKFLLVTVLWFFAYFLVYIPIAYQIRPRFFLPMLSLPFIFVGYITKYIWERSGKIWKISAAAILAGVLIGNLYGTYLWFKEIRTAQKKGTDPKRTIILKARDGIVLWHLENAENYIREDCKENTVYYQTSNEYKRPVEYLLGLQGVRGFTIDKLYSGQKNCVYSVLLTRSASTKLPANITDKFDVAGSQKFGAITVLKLSAKDEFVGQPLGYTNKPLPEAALESERVFWKDIFTAKKAKAKSKS
jgi:4-amino-4-deoxy-L-arabinose transferase-like glycosyltransferase